MENQSSDVEVLRDRYAAARNRYRPATIRTIIVAEAPSCSLDRYFYFEDVSKQDSLFLEIMDVLYPEEKEAYLKSKRDPVLKKELLQKFSDDGYWLVDLGEVPMEVSGQPYEESLPSLLTRLEKYIDKKVPVILIKSSVYDICYSELAAKGYNVINERMPFPGSGQQKVFREKFKAALENEPRRS